MTATVDNLARPRFVTARDGRGVRPGGRFGASPASGRR